LVYLLLSNARLLYHAFLTLNPAALKASNATMNAPATRTLFTRPNKDFISALLPDALRAIELDFVVLIK
jgi:hypothetical protein